MLQTVEEKREAGDVPHKYRRAERPKAQSAIVTSDNNGI